MTKRKLYGIYDLKSNETLVMVGNRDQLCEWTGMNMNTLSSSISKKIKIMHRYEIVPLEEYEDVSNTEGN